MPPKIRLSQVYELQRVSLINVHYYAERSCWLTKVNRFFQLVTALAASGTVTAVVRDIPPGWKAASIGISLISAIAASIVAVYNLSESIARLERMHAAYKLLYHSAETLAKQTIGAEALSPEQDAVASMLELQLASLGPQDEIGPDKKVMAKAQRAAERELPDSYYYPENA
ncbi:MAG: hypothetical protein JWO19_4502 [Bryobacterales bacterium]|nr:hypothetical protein [Bryobacterales bacterium]